MSDQAVHMEDLTFGGNETESVTVFLQRVKRVAFMQGRQRDQEWLVDYVETCLVEKALVWYTKLEERTRSDFNSLRVAMLEHFAIPVSIPPAAPAAPAAAAPTASIPARPPPQNPRGRISFVMEDGVFWGYCENVERMHKSQWLCYRTSNISKALIVELCMSSDPSRKSSSLLRVVDSNGETGDNCLGAIYLGETSGAAFWVLSFCDEGVLLPYPQARSLKNPSARAASKIWEVIDGTQELRAVWVNHEGVRSQLKVRSGKADDGLWFRLLDDEKLEIDNRG
ncbi:hypothetical protein FRB98_003120, partial [Tulasnella sp. 332]